MLRWALNGNLNVARISVMEVPGGRGKHGSVPPGYEKTFGGERPVRSVISMCATARPEANAKRGVYGGECARSPRRSELNSRSANPLTTERGPLLAFEAITGAQAEDGCAACCIRR